MNRTLIGLLSLAATAASTPLLAKVAEQFPSQHVSTAGLDLASRDGQAIAHRRIVQAASNVCGDADIHSLNEMGQMTRCRGLAIASAEQQLATRVALAGAKRSDGTEIALLKR